MRQASPTAPRIDGRTLAELRREILDLRRVYTPEWSAPRGDALDPGQGLLEAFTRLLDGVVQRIDRMPAKALLAFLDRLGVEPSVAQAARAPLAFTLSKGAAEPVTVPAGTQVAGEGLDGEPVTFETETAFVATPAKLIAVRSVVPARDAIVDHTAAVGGGAASTLFDAGSANLQEHSLYLGHENLFNLKGPARVELELTPPAVPGQGLADPTAVAWQYYRGTKEVVLADGAVAEVEDWADLGIAGADGGDLVLTKTGDDRLGTLEIGGTETRWIRCTVRQGRIAGLAAAELRGLKIRTLPPESSGGAGVAPDMAFHDDVELDLSKPFHPFGRRPRLFTVFYLAGEAAFSKPGAAITLTVTPAAGDPPGTGVPVPDPTLSWEYWNGDGWRAIPGLVDGTAELTATDEGTVTFPCPADLEPTEVLGQESHWIRVRLVGGDYGREVFSIANGEITATPHFDPPRLETITVDFAPPAEPPEVLLTRNNLDTRDVTHAVGSTTPLRPFAPLEDDRQALHLGFDRALERGPASLFVHLAEQSYEEDARPRIEWHYLRRRSGETEPRWARLAVEDATRGLTETGVVAFPAPEDAAEAVRFGTKGYWLRAVDTGDGFEVERRTDDARPDGGTAGPPVLGPPIFLDLSDRFLPSLRLPGGIGPPTPRVPPVGPIGPIGPTPTTGPPTPCAARDPRVLALARLPHPDLVSEAGLRAPAPRLAGLYLNATWARQTETIRDELLGSGTGTADQRFELARTPVIEEEIWLDELAALSDAEREELIADPSVPTREVRDDADRVRELRVRWRRIADLDAAAADDRVYLLDRLTGELVFGDGVRGRVPPVGRDAVRATYRTGGGTRGNVDAGAVTELRSTIPLVDGAVNPLAAGGGTDTEPVERAAARGPETIRHRGRAVSAADFEALARDASAAVARARCLPNFDDRGDRTTGWVTVVIVPESAAARPAPPRELRRRVETYLAARAPDVAAAPRRVRVIGPAWVEVAAVAELVPTTLDRAPEAETRTLEELDAFLHPLTGGPDGEGWPFGRLPCLSDLYGVLEAIDGVDHVESLRMVLQPVLADGTAHGEAITVTGSDDDVHLALPGHALVTAGEHRITSTPGTATGE